MNCVCANGLQSGGEKRWVRKGQSNNEHWPACWRIPENDSKSSNCDNLEELKQGYE